MARASDIQSPRLSEDDALAVELEVPGVVAVAPVLYARAQFTVGASNWTGSIRGVTPGYFTAREWGVTGGREMTSDDNSRAGLLEMWPEACRRTGVGGREFPLGVIKLWKQILGRAN